MDFSFVQFNPLILNVGYAEHNADWNWKNVRSPFSRIYYVDKGSAAVEINGKIYELKEGNLYMIPAYTLHNNICDSHFSHYYIHIYEEISSGSHFMDDWEFPFEITGTEFDRMLMERLCVQNPNMRLSKSDPGTYDNDSTLYKNITQNKSRTLSARMETRGMVYFFMSRFLEEAKLKVNYTDDRIETALEYIKKNINQSLDVEMLAQQACLSENHFIRLFKQVIGETPNKYITVRKIERAEYLLATGNMPVKNIAVSLGYDDHSYFIRLFRKVVGVTPSVYREQNNAKHKQRTVCL